MIEEAAIAIPEHELGGPRLRTWGQTTAFGLAPYRYLRHCQRRYGDTHRLQLAGIGDMVLFSAPEHIQQIFALRAADFRNGNDPVRYLLDARSVIFLEDDEHKRARRVLMRPFVGKALRGYAPRFVEAATHTTAAWSDGERVDLTAAFQQITFNALMEATLGMATSDCPEALRGELLRFVSGQLSSTMFFASAVMGPQLYARLRELTEVAKVRLAAGQALRAIGPIAARAHNLARVETWLTKLVETRRQTPTEGSDALSRLLVEDPAYPDAFVVHQLLTLLVAGHDTTSLALSWTACQLMARPELMARVAREATANVGSGGAVSVAEALPLTHATIRESLRITPGAAIAPRRLLRPVTIGGVEVPEGTVLAANVIGAHSRVETWTDPDVFRPERFLGKSPTPGTFLPFGGGLRRCLGAGFAETEMPLVIAMLLRDWVLEPHGSTSPRDSMHGFLIGPASHVWARVRNRHGSAS